jgi:hypothetical protein
MASRTRASAPHPPFFSDCVGWPRDQLGALELLIEESEEIGLAVFRDRIGRAQMRDLTRALGYDRHGLRIEADHHVRCAEHPSGAVMLVHSAIEHVFATPELIASLQERHGTGASLAMTETEALILVHPGSMCGSARSRLGRAEADAARAEVLERVRSHQGPLFVIDGALSDELSRAETLLIDQAVASALSSGQVAGRVWGCDSGERPYPSWSGLRSDGGRLLFDGQEEAAADVAPLLRDMTVLVTGAWAGSNEGSGCVNSVANAIREVLGREARVGIDETALLMPEEFEDPEP